MKPEWRSGNSSVRTATVLLFWACVSGCQVWDEMPGFAGKDSSGVAAFPWGLLGDSCLWSCKKFLSFCRVYSQIRKPCRREEAQSSNTAGQRMATSR